MSKLNRTVESRRRPPQDCVVAEPVLLDGRAADDLDVALDFKCVVGVRDA